MPRGSYAPSPAIGCEVDLAVAGAASSWSLFQRGDGDPVVITRALWPDAPTLANARCSRANVDLASTLQALGIGTALLSTYDRLVIAGAAPFAVLAGEGNRPYGLDPAGQLSAPGAGGLHYVIAAYDWQGGPVNARFTVRLDGSDYIVPGIEQLPDSLITMMRAVDLEDEDADGVDECIEARDNAIYGEVNEIRWGIDGLGHLYGAWPADAGIDDITWDTSTAAKRKLLRLLGRRGPDAAEHSTVDVAGGGQLRVWRASRPIAWLLVPDRPFGRPPEEGRDAETKGNRLKSGRTVTNVLGAWRTYKLGLHFAGPGAGAADLTEHWLRHVEPYLEGQITVWQEWAEPRRALAELDTDDVDAPYTLTRTAELRGRRGRLICSRPMRDARQRTIGYRNTTHAVADLVIDLDVLDPGAA